MDDNRTAMDISDIQGAAFVRQCLRYLDSDLTAAELCHFESDLRTDCEKRMTFVAIAKCSALISEVMASSQVFAGVTESESLS